ncbi:hypothetical protein PV08_10794 [Exophiala spinifera]|uniref:BTB domain-containing protein n=1 Tax=Exophiala spinifera TaxID=91928 RepID=A0A0D2BJM3_9EURO|nr:uncharacterized protein PV08_10794 [Exophiala spinifera]KIW11494.1 hypothetical protein PV08_10794 [Exophiala spinifera]
MATPPSTVFSSPIVTVLVGPGKAPYSVHKDVLVQASPFFADRLAQGTANNSTTNEVTFPDPDVTREPFISFIYWAYYGTIDPRQLNVFGSVWLKHSWLLAYKLRMPQWQNRIIDALIDTCWKKRRVEISELAWLVNHVPRHSNLFRLALDQFAYDISDKGVKYDDKELKRLFDTSSFSICDILRTIAGIAKSEEPIADRKRYYEPEKAEKVEEKKKRKTEDTQPSEGTTIKRPKSD